jgi:hypothetical protein
MYIRDWLEKIGAFELKKQTVHKEGHSVYSNFQGSNTWSADKIWLENVPSALVIRIRAFTMYRDPIENEYDGWSAENPCISQKWGGSFQYWANIKTIANTIKTLEFSIEDILTTAENDVIVPGVVLKAKGEKTGNHVPLGRTTMFACFHIEPST